MPFYSIFVSAVIISQTPLALLPFSGSVSSCQPTFPHLIADIICQRPLIIKTSRSFQGNIKKK